MFSPFLGFPSENTLSHPLLPLLTNPPSSPSVSWYSPILGHEAFSGPRASPPFDVLLIEKRSHNSGKQGLGCRTMAYKEMSSLANVTGWEPIGRAWELLTDPTGIWIKEQHCLLWSYSDVYKFAQVLDQKFINSITFVPSAHIDWMRTGVFPASLCYFGNPSINNIGIWKFQGLSHITPFMCVKQVFMKPRVALKRNCTGLSIETSWQAWWRSHNDLHHSEGPEGPGLKVPQQHPKLWY